MHLDGKKPNSEWNGWENRARGITKEQKKRNGIGNFSYFRKSLSDEVLQAIYEN